jgi:hypothetical protein
LKPLWAAWAKQTAAKETRMGREYAWTRLARELPSDAAPLHLTDALRALRESIHDQPAAFNRTRAAVLAFLRDKFGKRHALYEQLVDVPALKELKHKRTAPTIARAVEVRDALPAPAAAIWWTMYCTGMGPGEYDGPWEEHEGYIAIHGTKRDARDRIVPIVATPSRRGMGWTQFATALEPFGLQPYDARRGFAHLMEEAGITRIRRKMYFGHTLGDVTGGYEKAELTAFRLTDAALMLMQIGRAEADAIAARKRGMRSA